MSEIALQARQRWLQTAITAAVPSASAAPPEAVLADTPGFAAEARLAVYRHAYQARLLQSFQALYPALLRALGAEALNAFALDFLAQHPPREKGVQRVAQGFAAHLAATCPSAGAEAWEAFVLDLARLEEAVLAISEAAGTEPAPPPDAEPLRSLTCSRLLALRPQPSPCLRRLACRVPVHRYWQAREADPAPAIPAPAPTWLALTRVQYRLGVHELAQSAWLWLGQLDGSTCVAQAIERTAAQTCRPRPDADLARVWLANFCGRGLLAALDGGSDAAVDLRARASSA